MSLSPGTLNLIGMEVHKIRVCVRVCVCVWVCVSVCVSACVCVCVFAQHSVHAQKGSMPELESGASSLSTQLSWLVSFSPIHVVHTFLLDN